VDSSFWFCHITFERILKNEMESQNAMCSAHKQYQVSWTANFTFERILKNEMISQNCIDAQGCTGQEAAFTSSLE
jgi:hypothetical protein